MNRSIVALAPKFRLFRNKFAEMTSRPDCTLVVHCGLRAGTVTRTMREIFILSRVLDPFVTVVTIITGLQWLRVPWSSSIERGKKNESKPTEKAKQLHEVSNDVDKETKYICICGAHSSIDAKRTPVQRRNRYRWRNVVFEGSPIGPERSVYVIVSCSFFSLS